MNLDFGRVYDAVSLAKEAEPRLRQLKKATDQFEAVLIKQMVSAMRKTVNETKLGDNFGADIYKDMFDTQLSESMTSGVGLGISKMLYRQYAPVAAREERMRLRAEASADAPNSKQQGTPHANA